MVGLYIAAQFLCVITSTIKSIALLKANRHVAVWLTTGHYIINTLVTYLISKQTNIWILLATCALTNILGTYLGLWIMDKCRKDQLWRISATVKTDCYEQLIMDLKVNNLKFVTFETNWDKIKLIDVFSQDKKQSELIHRLFNNYKVKYTISCANAQL